MTNCSVDRPSANSRPRRSSSPVSLSSKCRTWPRAAGCATLKPCPVVAPPSVWAASSRRSRWPTLSWRQTPAQITSARRHTTLLFSLPISCAPCASTIASFCSNHPRRRGAAWRAWRRIARRGPSSALLGACRGGWRSTRRDGHPHLAHLADGLTRRRHGEPVHRGAGRDAAHRLYVVGARTGDCSNSAGP
jgi:hypothetical protein